MLTGIRISAEAGQPADSEQLTLKVDIQIRRQQKKKTLKGGGEGVF